MWIMLIPLGLIILYLVFIYGYTRGMDDLKSIENWGIGFDQGWNKGWDCGFDRGFLCGIQENQKNKAVYKIIDREEM